MKRLFNTSVPARSALLARAGRALAPAAPSLLESLEPRQMLSTYTVANLADTGAGSLRQAILDANSHAGADVVEFQNGLTGTITLGGTELQVTDDLDINGPGANLLTVSGNNASSVFNFQSGTSMLSGLLVTGAVGWGINNADTLYVLDSTLSGNSSPSFTGGWTVYDAGGGISNSGTMQLADSTISGNIGGTGGGILNSGTLTITSSTIANNSAPASGPFAGKGGGILNSGTLSIANSTIADNSAGNSAQYTGGGGIVTTGGTVSLVSSIVAGNMVAPGGGFSVFSSDVVGTLAPGSTNNLIQDAASAGGLTNAVNGNLVGVDPMLGALANNGGPTQTMALLNGGPAIGKGINPNNLTTDQRGFPIASGAAVDIGAYQHLGALVVDNNAADLDDGRYGNGELTLREAINIANASPGADSITFVTSLKDGKITLDAAIAKELTVTDDVTITGPGFGVLTIDGGGRSGIGSGAVGVPYAFNFTSGTSTLSGLLITGAMLGWGINNAGTLTIVNAAVVGNQSSVYFNHWADYGEGGGIRNSGTMVLFNTTVAGNSGGTGGGILNSGMLTINNSTIANNSTVASGPVGGHGGGILMSGGTLKLVSSIVAGNTNQAGAADGGGVSPSDIVGGTLAAGSTNDLIQGASSAGGLTNGANANIVGVDAKLVAFGVGVFIPGSGSPAINKGVNPNNLATDQRGGQRVIGGAIDIGAIEVGNSLSAEEFFPAYTDASKSTDGLVDGDWIADALKTNVPNVVTSDAYWGARNMWFQDKNGDVWSLWQGGDVHKSKTLTGQHEWVLTNLTDAGGLSGSMHLAAGSLSGVTTGWNAFSIQGIQDGKAWALWWSPQGSAGDYIDTDGSTKHGQGLGLKGNGWSFNSITAETTLIGGAITTPPAAFLAFSTSQANGRTEFDPRSTFVTANSGMAMIVVDTNHHVYALTFSTSQRAIAGANASLNGKWVIEPLSEVPSLGNFGLTSQEAGFEQAYVTAASK